jgi:hypothetical protein
MGKALLTLILCAILFFLPGMCAVALVAYNGG